MVRKAAIVVGLAGVLAAGPAMAQNSDLWGALLGGAGGAVVGSQFGKGKGRLASTAVGTLAGALVGQSVGRSLDRGDAAYYRSYGYDNYYAPAPVTYYEPSRHYHRSYYAAPPPRPVYYERPVVYQAPPPPPPRYAYASERYCREYTAPIWVGGREVQGYGQACMQPDGSWDLGPLQPVR